MSEDIPKAIHDYLLEQGYAPIGGPDYTKDGERYSLERWGGDGTLCFDLRSHGNNRLSICVDSGALWVAHCEFGWLHSEMTQVWQRGVSELQQQRQLAPWTKVRDL